jgi:hypothetical protein
MSADVRSPLKGVTPRFTPAPAAPGDGKKEDEATLPAPPRGFDARRDGIDRGKLETVEYDFNC